MTFFTVSMYSAGVVIVVPRVVPGLLSTTATTPFIVEIHSPPARKSQTMPSDKERNYAYLLMLKHSARPHRVSRVLNILKVGQLS